MSSSNNGSVFVFNGTVGKPPCRQSPRGDYPGQKRSDHAGTMPVGPAAVEPEYTRGQQRDQE